MKSSKITWDTLDWAALDRLRDTFLEGMPVGAGYWTSGSDLENYDLTFAQRIAWKWDAVLHELKLRGWTPPSEALIDWGCGSGIAGRRVIDFFGAEHFRLLRVCDRSRLAMDFAADKARETFPSLRVELCPDLACRDPLPSGGSPPKFARALGDEKVQAAPAADTAGQTPVRPDAGQSASPNRAGSGTGAPSVGTLVISHVLNELDEAGGRALREAIDRADAVLWAEPGTYADSRSLIELREALRERFHVIAPCTHQAGCGLRVPENGRHWCHHFASPPPNIMADSHWVRFARRAGIDLRSLPYSFLVLERRGARDPAPGLLPDGYSRIIGQPRCYKGFAKIFSCQRDGARELTLQRRDQPQFFKSLDRPREAVLFCWGLEGDRIRSVTPAYR